MRTTGHRHGTRRELRLVTGPSWGARHGWRELWRSVRDGLVWLLVGYDAAPVGPRLVRAPTEPMRDGAREAPGAPRRMRGALGTPRAPRPSGARVLQLHRASPPARPEVRASPAASGDHAPHGADAPALDGGSSAALPSTAAWMCATTRAIGCAFGAAG